MIPSRTDIRQRGVVLFKVDGVPTWVPLFSKNIQFEVLNLADTYGEMEHLAVFATIEECFTLLQVMKTFGLSRHLMHIVHTGLNAPDDTTCLYK